MIIENYNVKDEKKLEEIINKYETENFVIKPEGLTGGKGVKVGGIHFKGKQEGLEYAKKCMMESGNVIVQDRSARARDCVRPAVSYIRYNR